MSTTGDPCPVCGEGHLEHKQSTCEMVHLGVCLSAPMQYALCDCCGSEIADADDARANKEAMNRAKMLAKTKGETE